MKKKEINYVDLKLLFHMNLRLTTWFLYVLYVGSFLLEVFFS